MRDIYLTITRKSIEIKKEIKEDINEIKEDINKN